RTGPPGQPLAIGREDDVGDLTVFVPQLAEFLARRTVTQGNRAVPEGAGEGLANWRESKRCQGMGGVIDHGEFLPRADFPGDGFAVIAGHQGGSVGRKADERYLPVLELCKLAEFLCGGGYPKSNRVVLGARGKQLSIRREGQAGNVQMRRKVLQLFAAHDGPDTHVPISPAGCQGATVRREDNSVYEAR